ncbi:MAG: HAMP domain-containing histidine kinase [Bacteroidales bacterium]|nr:HAMP domain-containing histidine kinase [Bacteroidales bacterium]
MPSKAISSILSEWTDEFNLTLLKNTSLCVALFSAGKELLFMNNSMKAIMKGDPSKSFINPDFDKILSLNNDVPLVFDGVLTLGDYNSINTSIVAQVYRKDDRLLVLGGVDTSQLIEQNVTMHHLNREISNLQRELIKEKHILENTLSQLNQANNALKELNTGKDRFISILAHDLKSPLGSMLGFTGLLKNNITTYSKEKIKSQVDIVYNATQHTLNLLDDILLWVKAESDRLPYEPQKHSLDKIIAHVLKNLRHIAENKNILIHHDVAGDLHIFGDINMVQTVLRNLVSNAIKFTSPGGRITVYAIQEGSSARITVSDTGVGIRPETLNKLFNISHKITTEGTNGEKGTGLGLLLCKEFVEKHGGKIWVESELGKGCDFKFTLPLFL